jgi:hypothetical protein
VPHLVDSLTPEIYGDAGVLSLVRCHALLGEAHDYLARHGAEAARRAALLDDATMWGTHFKRVRVELPRDARPLLMRAAEDHHSLAEVVNQCATMERLLDALAWARTDTSGLSAFCVVRCHPTTGSAASDVEAPDNDLILTAPDGRAARFEVSDVASASDGNRKEERDLRSLGLLREGRGAERYDVRWPDTRVFLVVSSEFAGRLRGRRWPHLVYREVFAGAGTVVVEVLPKSTAT